MPSNYTLQNVEDSRRAYPRSFSIPRGDVRRTLKPGWLVKLVFNLPEPVDNYDAERMWVEVVAPRDDGAYVGRLDNEPLFVKQLAYNDEVVFEPQHVAALENGDDRRLGALVGVGVDVLRHGQWPAWIVKVEPTSKHDSGWRAFSEREATEGATVRALSTSTLFRSWAVTDSVIDVDADGAWRYDEDSLEYLRVEALPARLEAAAHGGLGKLHGPTPDADMGVVVTQRALEVAPLTAQKLAPSKGHEDDSGWCIYVGDEAQEYLDDPENSTVVTIARLLHDYPYLERVLGERELATWTWNEEAADWKLVPGSKHKSKHTKAKPKLKLKLKAKAKAKPVKKAAKKPAKKAKPAKPATKKPAKTKPRRSRK